MKSQLELAIDLAVEWHGEQRYGKLPYIAHLMDVDRWVVERNGYDANETLRPIAFLHDVLEDTEATGETLIIAGVSQELVVAIELLTKKCGQGYKDYLEAIIANELAREVKICDTMANLTQSVKKNNAKRIAKYTRQLAILSKGEYFE